MEHKIACIAFGFGCPRAEVDTAISYHYLQQNGWYLTDRIGKADIVLVSTCGVTADVERRSLELLSYVSNHIKKYAKLVVIGCLSGINPVRLA